MVRVPIVPSVRRRSGTWSRHRGQKGRNLWTIDPDATVLDALAKMAEKDIGSLVVMDHASDLIWRNATQ